MPKTLRPGPGKIVVKPFPPEQQLDVGGGAKLWLISDVKNEGIIGEVIANHGQDYIEDGRRVSPDYKVGAVVVIGKYTGTKLSVDRETVIVVPEQSIIAEILDEPDLLPPPAPESGPGDPSAESDGPA